MRNMESCPNPIATASSLLGQWLMVLGSSIDRKLVLSLVVSFLDLLLLMPRDLIHALQSGLTAYQTMDSTRRFFFWGDMGKQLGP